MDETLKRDGDISSLTSFMMLRRDSSSLIPREKVRFLGEPLLSRATESMFGVCVADRVIWRRNTPVCPRFSTAAGPFGFLRNCEGLAADAQARILRQAEASNSSRPRSAHSLAEVESSFAKEKNLPLVCVLS